MSGIIPDLIAGYVNVTDGSRAPIAPVPQTGLFTNAGTAYTVGGGLSYLQLPSTNGVCGGRIVPSQINFLESEMLALAAKVNPTGTWTPAAGNNLAAAFTIGVPILDATGHILLAQLPTALQGAMSYQGVWNASTNSPPLASGAGTKGYVYRVSVAGATTLDSITSWYVGDMAVFNGTTWDNWDAIPTEVISVAGRTGAIVLTSADLTDISSYLLAATAASTYAPLASPALTGAPTAPTPTVGDNSTKLATTAFVLANSAAGGAGAGSSVRQTVLSGPQTAGVPSFLPATTGSLSITTQNISAGTPLIVSVANGFGASGNVDVISQSTANLTWTGLPANSTIYLTVYISGGVVMPAFNLIAPIYQYGGTISVVNGQLTFDISQMKMFQGNGTTFAQAPTVYVGEAVTNATTVTSTTAYQYRGYFDSGFIATLPGTGTQVIFNSNLGISDQIARLQVKNTSPDTNYVIGDTIELLTTATGAGSFALAVTYNRNTASFTTGSGIAFQGINKSTGVQFILSAGNWAYRIFTRRSWGGA